MGVSRGKHFFSVSVSHSGRGAVNVGFIDRALRAHDQREHGPGDSDSAASGATFWVYGRLFFGTSPMPEDSDSYDDGKDSSYIDVPLAPIAQHTFVAAPKSKRPSVVGCLLDLDATPARMTVFVDGEPLAEQCPYDFPKDGRAWFPTVALCEDETALHSCAM